MMDMFTHLFALLFYQFHIQERTPLDFSAKHRWYFDRLFYRFGAAETDDPDNDFMSYASCYKIMNGALEKAGKHWRFKTHAGRKGGMAQAADEGASFKDVTLVSRHDQHVAERNYFKSLPATVVAANTGMGKPENCYYPCEDVEIPDELKKQIFPWARDRLKYLKDDNFNRPQDPYAPDGRDRAGEAFLEMMTDIAPKVLITAAALLQDEFPEHVVFNHTIFKSALFQDVKKNMLAAMQSFEENGNPLPLEIQAAAPAIADKMR